MEQRVLAEVINDSPLPKPLPQSHTTPKGLTRLGLTPTPGQDTPRFLHFPAPPPTGSLPLLQQTPLPPSLAAFPLPLPSPSAFRPLSPPNLAGFWGSSYCPAPLAPPLLAPAGSTPWGPLGIGLQQLPPSLTLPSTLGQRSPPPSSYARPPSSRCTTPFQGCTLSPFLPPPLFLPPPTPALPVSAALPPLACPSPLLPHSGFFSFFPLLGSPLPHNHPPLCFPPSCSSPSPSAAPASLPPLPTLLAPAPLPSPPRPQPCSSPPPPDLLPSFQSHAPHPRGIQANL